MLHYTTNTKIESLIEEENAILLTRTKKSIKKQKKKT